MKIYKQRFKQRFKESIPKEEAYWISPKGKILPLSKMSKHIHEIIKNPEAFGLTLPEIQKIFDEEGENINSEGKAREKIILNLLKQGWIRIRKYNRPDRWTVNVPSLTTRIKDYLQNWASEMIKSGWGKYSDVYIDSPKDRKFNTLTAISQDILYTENNQSIPDNRHRLKLVEIM